MALFRRSSKNSFSHCIERFVGFLGSLGLRGELGLEADKGKSGRDLGNRRAKLGIQSLLKKYSNKKLKS